MVVVQEESTGSIVDKESAVCKILPELYKEFLATSPSGEQEENIFYNTLTRSLNGINDTTPSGGTIYGYEDWYTDPSYGQYDSGRESATTEENSNPDIMSLYKISAGDKQCDMVFVVKGQAPKLSKKNYTYIPVLYTKYHALQKLQEYLTEMIKDRKSYQENLVKSKQKLQSIGIDTN